MISTGSPPITTGIAPPAESDLPPLPCVVSTGPQAQFVSRKMPGKPSRYRPTNKTSHGDHETNIIVTERFERKLRPHGQQDQLHRPSAAAHGAACCWRSHIGPFDIYVAHVLSLSAGRRIGRIRPDLRRSHDAVRRYDNHRRGGTGGCFDGRGLRPGRRGDDHIQRQLLRSVDRDAQWPGLHVEHQRRLVLDDAGVSSGEEHEGAAGQQPGGAERSEGPQAQRGDAECAGQACPAGRTGFELAYQCQFRRAAVPVDACGPGIGDQTELPDGPGEPVRCHERLLAAQPL